MKDAYDKKRQEAPQYKPGDLVLLNMKNIRTTRQMKKLDNLRDGPLEVVRKVGKASYQLKLPIAWAKAGIHPVFNETLLHPYHKPVFPSQQTDPPPPPDIIDDHEEFEVERILDARMRRGKVQYLVKWKGYPDVDNLWIPIESCQNAREELDDFYRRFPSKPRPTTLRRLELPLVPELLALMRPLPTPVTEPIDDDLPSELQLNRLAFKSHRGR